ncbi:hypothetical protein LTR28_007640, partial [Elasticomyces elasticus]
LPRTFLAGASLPCPAGLTCERPGGCEEKFNNCDEPTVPITPSALFGGIAAVFLARPDSRFQTPGPVLSHAALLLHDTTCLTLIRRAGGGLAV